MWNRVSPKSDIIVFSSSTFGDFWTLLMYTALSLDYMISFIWSRTTTIRIRKMLRMVDLKGLVEPEVQLYT
jgi:hypothetical protein